MKDDVESAKSLFIGFVRAVQSSMKMHGQMTDPVEKQALALGHITLGASMALSFGMPLELVLGAINLASDPSQIRVIRDTVGREWMEKVCREHEVIDILDKVEANSPGGKA